MRYILECFRVVFISGEVLSVVLAGALLMIAPQLFASLGSAIRSNSEILKYLPAIPISLCGYSIFLAWKILAPLDDSNRELYDWLEFWRIKLRIAISVGFAVLAVVSVLGGWIFWKKLDDALFGALFAVGLLVSVINCGSMLFAAFSIKVIVEKDDE